MVTGGSGCNIWLPAIPNTIEKSSSMKELVPDAVYCRDAVSKKQ